MAITTRQTGLLVSEDWTKLYQTFRNADFQSYDYETLRKSMVDYLRLYYPEDFNDFIESSEFIALLDLIAFLGQSLAFRGDLNTRENFIDTAQRRDSILKLAKLISYNPKRNTPATGLLKIDSVSTSEVIYDSNGINLSGIAVGWDDGSNDNWLEQFTVVINAALNSNQAVGNPSNSQTLNGVLTDEYQINLIPNVVATYSYKTGIEGVQTAFELVSGTTANQAYIYESAPAPNKPFNLIYKNDNLGNSSNNTGFFIYFKQGELKSLDVNFQESVPNRVFGININNINNNDIWLYSIDANGNLDKLWTQVPNLGVTNIIYNQVQSSTRTLYQINTRGGDQVDLIFGDGSFADIPQGRFRVYYRVSNGLQYKITPDEMQGITVSIAYISRIGRPETLTVRASLQYTVNNAATRESLDEIKQKAPQQYYTQDRMITGEDYNILPYTLFSSVLKVKAVNRTSSGVSRYLDVIDTTGKYSSTNIFAEDGILYTDEYIKSFAFEFSARPDIFKIINNNIKSLIRTKEFLQFFYNKFDKVSLVNLYWKPVTELSNGSTGFFYNDLNSSGDFIPTIDSIAQVGPTVSNTNKFITQGAILRFTAGSGKYFNAQNQITLGQPSLPGDKQYIYATVQEVVADGTASNQGILNNGNGPITINQIVPYGAEADRVFRVFNYEVSSTLVNSMVDLVESYADFGLRYDAETNTWKIIQSSDLNKEAEFSLVYSGNTGGTGQDSSWFIRFDAAGVGQAYTVYYRGLNYIFQSVKETNFYFDEKVKIFDQKTGVTINDQIKILKINNQPDSSTPLGLDYTWFIYKNIVDTDGYEDPNKVLITFPDSDADGVPDNPDLFQLLVDPTTNPTNKLVYFKLETGYDSFIQEVPIDNTTVISIYNTVKEIRENITLYKNGQLFYILDKNEFYQLDIVNETVYNVKQVFNFKAKQGRQSLYFQYRHNSPNYRRIDPSPNNIIDLYILNKQYANDYIAWIQDSTNTVSKPEAPTADSLRLEYGSLEKYKGVADTLIYNPTKFKPVFGNKADESLQAIFKVVKNPNIVISDNEIKTSVISAVNDFFDINNWDFGETFYFSELSAFLHSKLAPNIASIVIVPASESSVFGSLLQINAEYNEIIISSATVENVQVIPAITAAQINQNFVV